MAALVGGTAHQPPLPGPKAPAVQSATPTPFHCPLVLVVTGSRELSWPVSVVKAALLAAAGGQPVELLLHGGARGADTLAGQAAELLGWPEQVMRAEWNRYGCAAGPIRNRQMLQAACRHAAAARAEVLVLGLPGGNGTEDCLRQARMLRRAGALLRIERLR